MTDIPPQDPSDQQGSTPPPPQPFGQQPMGGATPPPPSEPFGQPPAGSPIPPPPPPSMPPQNQAPQPGAYYSNQQGYTVSGPKNDPFAITGMVVSLVSILGICCTPVGIILGIVGTTFSGVSMSKIKKSNGQLSGNGMALAGLIIGITMIVICIGLLVASLVLNFNSFDTTYSTD